MLSCVDEERFLGMIAGHWTARQVLMLHPPDYLVRHVLDE